MYYNKNTVIYHNGKFLKATEAKTDLYGQTLHYGYGVFEGIRAYKTSSGTKIFKAKEHYERLKRSAELIHLPFKYSLRELEKISYQVLKKNKLENAYLRPLLYCDPNMSLYRAKKVNLMICAWDWVSYFDDKLLKLCVSSYQRPNPKSVKVEAKTCGNYVNSILATIEAKDKGFDEALLLDLHENIAEGPGANFFCEKEGHLFTPHLGNILPGITRSTVIELCAKLHIPCTERRIRPEALKNMDSAFYCGTAAEITGIASIDHIRFTKKWSDTSGAKIQQAYSNLVHGKKLTEQTA